MSETDDRLDQPNVRHAGDVIILANAIGTAAFAITAATAAIVFTTSAQWVGAITAMSLFAVGVFAFLWSFWNVVQRSREELIGVTQVYLLIGSPTPSRVRLRMLGLLAVQILVALVTALSRTETADGRAGSSLALGVLVPMFGLGLNGLWAAYHGTFPPIPERPDTARPAPQSAAEPATDPVSDPVTAPDPEPNA
jgi:hypothetical protein